MHSSSTRRFPKYPHDQGLAKYQVSVIFRPLRSANPCMTPGVLHAVPRDTCTTNGVSTEGEGQPGARRRTRTAPLTCRDAEADCVDCFTCDEPGVREHASTVGALKVPVLAGERADGRCDHTEAAVEPCRRERSARKTNVGCLEVLPEERPAAPNLLLRWSMPT
jgi:hypothetical protein